MNFLKRELYQIRLAFGEFHRGWAYLYARVFHLRWLVRRLPALDRPATSPDLSVHMLVSHHDLLLLFCSLATYYRVITIVGQLYIHNDGSLTARDRRRIKKYLPYARIVEPNDVFEKYPEILARYPVWKSFRMRFAHVWSFKKIIDPYIVAPGSLRLIIDSDMLWFQAPVELETSIAAGGSQAYMMANGRSISLKKTDGSMIDEQFSWLNAGIILYQRDQFDVGRFSSLLEQVEATPENLHFVDQVGHAYCLKNVQPLPEAHYHIKGKIHAETMVRHYTSPNRSMFYIDGVRRLKEILYVRH
jgi:hypothetical protein